MGFASLYDTWVTPLVRDWKIFVPMLGFYFGAQYACTKLLPKLLGRKLYAGMKQETKDDLVLRGCSIVNGILMTGSVALFMQNLARNGFRFPPGFYDALPHYAFFRMSIVAYFAWDIVTCFVYKWSLAWKVHGVFSFLGNYTLAFPFSDNFGGYYTGCFEMSNAPLHVSIILRTIVSNIDLRLKELKSSSSDATKERKKEEEEESQQLEQRKEKLNHMATISEYVFGSMYFVIRVLGGTYVTGTWLSRSVPAVVADLQHRGETNYTPQLHDELAVSIAIFAVVVIQGLQYIWFGEIVKRALGIVPVVPEEKKEK